MSYKALSLAVSVPQRWKVDEQFEAWIRCEATCVISQGWQGINTVLKHTCICIGNPLNFINLRVSTFLEREGWNSHELVIILSGHDTDFTIKFNQGKCSILWPSRYKVRKQFWIINETCWPHDPSLAGSAAAISPDADGRYTDADSSTNELPA